MVPRAVCLLLGFGFASLHGAVASADDGPPRSPSAAGPLRPPETVERTVGFGSRELLLLVGGYGTDPSQRSLFEPLVARFPGYQVRSFGDDGARYDTRGSVDVNAASLVADVRRSVREEDIEQVHVVTHSMGGSVADQAFAQGLGARDNVASYTAFAAPHRGSTTAAVTLTTVALSGEARKETSAVMRWIGRSSGDDAALRELARRGAPEAPRGVRTLEIDVVNDELVFGADSGLAGARRATLPILPLDSSGAIGAHGLVLRDAIALAYAEANVQGREIDRPWWQELPAQAAQRALDVVRLTVVAVLASGVLAAGRVLHVIANWR